MGNLLSTEQTNAAAGSPPAGAVGSPPASAVGSGREILPTTIPITTLPPEYIKQPLATEIISKQQRLINNLEQTIEQNRILGIESNPTPSQQAIATTTKSISSISRFANVNPVSDYYTPPFNLANTNAPELKDYVDAYNKSVSLLDDPNQLNQAKFDTYIHLQNKKLAELQSALDTFPTNGNIVNPIKAIKNLQTSVSLNVEEYPDPANKNTTQSDTYSGNGATKYPNYLIYGNNGCLQYNKTVDNNMPATWSFQPCNSNLPEQRFNMSKINTLDDYNAKITNPINKNYQISDTNSVIMGFYVVNPETDANQCMTLNNDGLSVMPCTIEASQRFKPFYHSITP
jgi:hypothetical protein